MRQPRYPTRKADPFSAGKMEQMGRMVDSINPITGAGRGVTVTQTPGGTSVSFRRSRHYIDYRFGYITDAGPAGDDFDFWDERYWVYPAYMEPGDERTVQKFYPDPPAQDENGDDTEPFPLIAQNLFEYKTHFMKTDGTELVQIFAWIDDGGVKHWDFYAVPRPFFGNIVATGPASAPDFTDCRYWVQMQTCYNTMSDDFKTLLNLGAFDTPENPADPGTTAARTTTARPGYIGPDIKDTNVTYNRILCCTNIAEYVSDNHDLSAGDKVLILFTSDRDGLPRYYFDRAPTTGRSIVPVNVTRHAGQPTSAEGTNSPLTVATLRYDLTDIDGTSVGTNQAWDWARPSKGHVTAGTKGFAFKDSDGTYTLINCDEVYDTENCPA